MVTAPMPRIKPGYLRVDTTISLISTGTEKMLVGFGQANLVQKAMQQPEKVKQVLAKVQTDGLANTIDAVRSKLGQPIPLGYCNVGRVNSVGAGLEGFHVGDRVISNGAHADVVCVPGNLAARIPDEVSDELASFTVIASIGLQGLRLAQPTLGEAFVVTGVGLIGLLTVQLLIAQGCRVLAIDFDESKLELARQFGAQTCNPGMGEDPVSAGVTFSRGAGVDGVIITASTKSSDPVCQAAQMSRQRGRIILVGVTGLALNRADFYEKELSFQVSCSYGPGRYDRSYEEGGHDYPYGLVRWTEQRNFEAVLDMMSSGRIDVSSLITHRIAFEKSPEAYQVLTTNSEALGIILEYNHALKDRHIETIRLHNNSSKWEASEPVTGFIGAGNYASRMLIPAFKSAGTRLHTIASSGGISGAINGKKSGFEYTTSNTEELIENPDINTLAIATRHNSHAALTIDALRAGKHVYVEKPLAMNKDELAQIEGVNSKSNSLLMVGFNRRFSPHIRTMKRLLDGITEPKSFLMLMNAGEIPADHWTQDPLVGGGRIIGEACHYIDLMRFLAGSEIISAQARCMGEHNSVAINEDKTAITLGFADGSFGTIHYLANGPASFPKERIEVFSAGKILQLDNFRKMRGFGWSNFQKQNLSRQDKGVGACVEAFLDAIKSGKGAPIPASELFEVARVTIEIAESLKEQQ